MLKLILIIHITNRRQFLPFILINRSFHATEKSEAIACARRCRSSRLTRWWTQKEYSEKWRAEEEEERHKGSLTPPPPKKNQLPQSNRIQLYLPMMKESDNRVTRCVYEKISQTCSPIHFLSKLIHIVSMEKVTH
jgi:hypothetical protein